jgi:hypothetical protein
MSARAGRTYTLLLGIGAVGALVWVATRIGEQSTWRYWATMGVLAGGGLAFALAQRTAYGAWSEVTPLGFLLALVAAVVCAGWIAAAGQPTPNWLRDHVLSWSHDLGIRGFVESMSVYVPVLAFGFGALLASAPGAFERVRRPAAAAAHESVQADQPAPAAERPVDGDGTMVRTPEHTRV